MSSADAAPGPLAAAGALLGLYGGRRRAQVVSVTGGAGGTAAVVEDVTELGLRLDAAHRAVDDRAALAELALAALDAQALALWAPGEASAASGACASAATRLGLATARLEAMVRAIALAGEAYAGTEAAITRAWHLVTPYAAPGALGLVVVTGALHDGLGAVGTGAAKATAAEIALDGLPTRVGLESPAGERLRERAEQLTGVRGAPGLVDDSPLRRATALAAAAYPRSGYRITPLPPLEQYDIAGAPGLEGLVAGVAIASDRDEITVRRRRVEGPLGVREAYVVDLPGTDAWLPGSDSVRDLGSSTRQLGGVPDDAYVEAVLALVDEAPEGSTVVLVGHSLGGLTASTVAAVAATRGRRVDYVVAAGSPVDTTRVPRGTTVVSLQNAADVVPGLDGMPARDVAGRTTVVVADDRGSTGANHAIDTYRDAARSADELARSDPGLRRTHEQMARSGALLAPGDRMTEQVLRYEVRRSP